jgi:Variant SH3 domain
MSDEGRSSPLPACLNVCLLRSPSCSLVKRPSCVLLERFPPLGKPPRLYFPVRGKCCDCASSDWVSSSTVFSTATLVWNVTIKPFLGLRFPEPRRVERRGGGRAAARSARHLHRRQGRAFLASPPLPAPKKPLPFFFSVLNCLLLVALFPGVPSCLTQQYIPEHNDHLTLELDRLVYVFSKQTGTPGFWEGDVNGLVGIFPSSHLKVRPVRFGYFCLFCGVERESCRALLENSL